MVTGELKRCQEELVEHLNKGLIPFWMNNGVDTEYGGYFTCFDQNGMLMEEKEKNIVTQSRMIWGYSNLYRQSPKEEYKQAAKQGVEFLIAHFWDESLGGWYWKVSQEGEVLDNGKVVYGQTFAIYALSEYTIATKEKSGLMYASETFDLIQKYCTDTLNGGYFENMETDWSLSSEGFAAGDLKSLDIHMYAMEAFTTLYECSGQEIHRRKLQEIIELLFKHMINVEIGCGYNQFDISFHRRPAINIRRTWNAERETGEVIEAPTDTTSYGHNIEFVWLLNRACDILGEPFHTYDSVSRKLVDHAFRYGFDEERGGVYRDGPHEGEPLVKDKEWWQNCEALVGFLDAYERLGDEKYATAFIKTWDFDYKYMINHKVGEWYQLLKEDGTCIINNIGNPWKGMYHTGRAMLECQHRLARLLGNEAQEIGKE